MRGGSKLVIAAIATAIVAIVALVAWRFVRDPDVASSGDAAIAKPETARALIKRLKDRPDGTLLGGVASAAGPLPGTVCAQAERADPLCVLADAAGAYAIDAPPGSYVVWASARGHRGQRREQVLVTSEARTTIDFTLAPGGEQVRGQVRDPRGTAIPNARVFGGVGRGTREAATLTGPDGTFELWLPAGDVELAAVAEGFVDGEASATIPEAGTIEVVLLPESVLAGTVVEAGTQRPIAGASIDVWGGHATSADDGTYRIAKLEPGRYKPTATAIGAYGEARESIRLGLGQTVTGVTIELHPVAAVVGRIQTDATPAVACPEGAGSVQLARYGSSAYYRTDTTLDGVVVLEGVVPGTYEVSAWCKDHLAIEPYPDLVVGTSDVEDAVFAVKRGAKITGIVVDAAGAPIAEASVRIMFAGAMRAAGAITQADGTFAFDGAEPGGISVSASADVFTESESIEAVASLAAPVHVRIVLARGGSIAGTVVDPTGAPLRRARVRLRGGPGATTDAQGAFLIEGLDDEEYEILVDREWYSELEERVTKVKVELGRTARVRLVAPIDTGTITGVVKDGTGAIIDDARVDVARLTGEDELPPFRGDQQLVKPDGTFVIGALPPGTYAVRARRDGAGEGVVTDLALGANITVTIAATGVLAGVVKTPTGGAPSDVTIEATDRIQNVSRDERLFHTGGVFAIRDLPAGTYQITVDHDVRSTITVDLAAGQRREDLVLTAQLRYVLKGRFVDAKGAPRAGWKASAPKLESDSPLPGGRRIITYTEAASLTGADGRFLLRDIPGGEVEISARDVRTSAETEEVVVKRLELGGPTTVVELGDLVVPDAPAEDQAAGK